MGIRIITKLTDILYAPIEAAINAYRRFPAVVLLSCICMGMWVSALTSSAIAYRAALVYTPLYALVWGIFAALLNENGVFPKKEASGLWVMGVLLVLIAMPAQPYQIAFSFLFFMAAVAYMSGGGFFFLLKCAWHTLKAGAILAVLFLISFFLGILYGGAGAVVYVPVAWAVFVNWLGELPVLKREEAGAPSKRHKSIGTACGAFGILFTVLPIIFALSQQTSTEHWIATHDKVMQSPLMKKLVKQAAVPQPSRERFAISPLPPEVKRFPSDAQITAAKVPDYDYFAQYNNVCILSPLPDVVPDINHGMDIKMGEREWNVIALPDGRMHIEDEAGGKTDLDFSGIFYQLRGQQMKKGYTDWDVDNHFAGKNGMLGKARFRVRIDSLKGPAPDGAYCYGFTLFVKFL